MLIDSHELTFGQRIEADICIVGAGAVGISMALELDGSNKKVVILESGGLEYNKHVNSLYKGKNIGRPTYPLTRNRLRYFGGTTNHWAGHCRPFDQFDLSPRDWIPHSGWPINFEDIDPYLERSQPIMQLGEYDYDSIDEYAKELGYPTMPLDSDRLINVMKHQSPPTRFGPTYLERIKKSKNVSVYLYANVLELLSNESGSHVTAASVVCIRGPEFSVKAKDFVLAAGGLENPRLMLLSSRSVPTGLGNSNGLVGKFYTDHILIRPALNVSLSRSDVNFDLYTKLHQINGGQIFGIMTAAEEMTRREKMTRFRAHLYNMPRNYGSSGGKVFSKLDIATRPLPKFNRRRDSIFLHFILEPLPNPNNFVRLSNDRDFLGQRKLEVNWQVTDGDRRNALRGIEILALEFARMGYGRAHAPMLENPDEWPDNMTSGKHHSSTTRMSDSPKTGVIDKNCKAFDLDNLYLTGSGVFPNIGHTNPTLNLIALALRLADHLKEKRS